MRICVVCLDGATWRILGPMIEEGKLDNLSLLKKTGLSGILKSVYPPLSAPAWVSFLSAMNPGKHGVFDFDLGLTSNYQYRKQQDKSKKKLVDSSVYNETPNLFDILNDNEKSVFCLSLPISYPPRPLNGFLFTGFLTPPSEEIFTFPHNMSSEVKERFPSYSPDILFKTRPSGMQRQTEPLTSNEKETAKQVLREILNVDVSGLTESEVIFLREILAVSRRKLEILEWCRSKGRFPKEVNILYFRDLDLIQHFFWERKDLICAAYKYCDSLLGEILRYFDPQEDYTFVLSDHGFGPIEKTIVYLNTYLVQSGYLKVQSNGLKEKSVRQLRSKVRSSFLKKYLSKMKFVSRRKAYLNKIRYPDIDFGNSTAWADGIGGLEGIYLNPELKEADREEIKNRIIDDLTNNYPDYFQGIHSKEDLYSGPYVEKIPDIVTIPKSGVRCSLDFDTQIIRKATDSPEQSGHHRAEMDGIFLCAGPSVSKISPDQPYSLMDIVPSILHLMDCKIDTRMDGKIIEELFSENDPDQKAPEYFEYQTHTIEHQTQKKSDEGVIDQLKNLGYLD